MGVGLKTPDSSVHEVHDSAEAVCNFMLHGLFSAQCQAGSSCDGAGRRLLVTSEWLSCSASLLAWWLSLGLTLGVAWVCPLRRPAA